MAFMILTERTNFIYASETNRTCGDNLTWEFHSGTGTLSISGNGRMDDYGDMFGRPWYQLIISDIVEVVINDGVQSIGDHAFERLSQLERAVIPDSVMSIGKSAFADCRALREAVIPGSVQYIGDESFYYCDSMKTVSISGVTFHGVGKSNINYAFTVSCS